MCGRRGETREGSEIQNCRILEKVIGKEFFKSSFVNSWIQIQHARPFPTVRAADSFAQGAAADTVLLAELWFVDLGAWGKLTFDNSGANLIEHSIGESGSF